MRTYYIKTGPGRYDVESVWAAQFDDSDGRGRRFLDSHGTVVRTVPIGTPPRVITVTEIWHQA